MAAIAGGAIAGIGSLAGGMASAGGAEQAAQTSANAQLQMFNEAANLEAPTRVGSQNAFGQYLYSMGIGEPMKTTGSGKNQKETSLIPTPAGGWSGTFGQYMQPYNAEQMYADPGYQFRLQQGEQALGAQGAATGMYGSGNMGIALENYGQQMGSQEYGASYGRYTDTMNRMASLAGLAPSTASNVGSQAVSTGAGMGSSLLSGGLASSQMMGGMFNQLGSLGGNMMNYGMLQNMLSGQSGGSGIGYTSPNIGSYGSGNIWDSGGGGFGSTSSSLQY